MDLPPVSGSALLLQHGALGNQFLEGLVKRTSKNQELFL
jgi:hypothetical protein